MGRITAPCLNVFGHTLSDHERSYLHARVSDVSIEEWPDRGHHVHLAEADRFASRLRSFIAQCWRDRDRLRSGRENVITPARMDELVDEHFRAEVAGDLQAIADGFTADAEHDVAGRPGPVDPARLRLR